MPTASTTMPTSDITPKAAIALRVCTALKSITGRFGKGAPWAAAALSFFFCRHMPTGTSTSPATTTPGRSR